MVDGVYAAFVGKLAAYAEEAWRMMTDLEFSSPWAPKADGP